MRWVHQACLMQWIQLSNARRCEVCGADFVFEPVYLPGTPSKLPPHEFLLGLSVRSARLARFCLRVRRARAAPRPA
jgi:E3 ubiquitin-protein ligase MARCH6